MKYALCEGSGWPGMPTIDRVEEKTPEEVAQENGMARQLHIERYWLPLDYAKRRFPRNAWLQAQ